MISPIVTWTGANGGGSGLSSPLTTGSQTTTGANLIVACITSNVVITSVTDSKGNTYAKAPGSAFANGGGDQVSIWTTSGTPTVGASHTVSANWTGTAAVTLCARAYSAAATSSIVDQHSEGTGTSSSLSSGSIVTLFTNELLILSGTMSSGSDLTFTGTDGFTVQSQSGQATVTTTGFLADQIVSATGTYPGTATCSQSGNWACGQLSIKSDDSVGGALPANQYPRPFPQRNIRHSGRYMRSAGGLLIPA